MGKALSKFRKSKNASHRPNLDKSRRSTKKRRTAGLTTFANPSPKVPQLDNVMLVFSECKSKFEELELGHRRGLQQLLGTAAHVAHQFDRDLLAWSEFTKLPIWKKLRKRDRPRPGIQSKLPKVSYVIRGMMNALHGSLYKRACKYARLTQYLVLRRYAPADIPKAIEDKGGIEKVYQEACKFMLTGVPGRAPRPRLG
jgi:hypothetical protein